MKLQKSPKHQEYMALLDDSVPFSDDEIAVEQKISVNHERRRKHKKREKHATDDQDRSLDQQQDHEQQGGGGGEPDESPSQNCFDSIFGIRKSHCDEEGSSNIGNAQRKQSMLSRTGSSSRTVNSKATTVRMGSTSANRKNKQDKEEDKKKKKKKGIRAMLCLKITSSSSLDDKTPPCTPERKRNEKTFNWQVTPGHRRSQSHPPQDLPEFDLGRIHDKRQISLPSRTKASPGTLISHDRSSKLSNGMSTLIEI